MVVIKGGLDSLDLCALALGGAMNLINAAVHIRDMSTT